MLALVDHHHQRFMVLLPLCSSEASFSVPVAQTTFSTPNPFCFMLKGLTLYGKWYNKIIRFSTATLSAQILLGWCSVLHSCLNLKISQPRRERNLEIPDFHHFLIMLELLRRIWSSSYWEAVLQGIFIGVLKTRGIIVTVFLRRVKSEDSLGQEWAKYSLQYGWKIILAASAELQ